MLKSLKYEGSIPTYRCHVSSTPTEQWWRETQTTEPPESNKQSHTKTVVEKTYPTPIVSRCLSRVDPPKVNSRENCRLKDGETDEETVEEKKGKPPK